MSRMKKLHITFLFFVFISILFVTGPVFAANPVLDFVGGSSGLVNDNDADITQKNQANAEQQETHSGGFLSFVKNLFGFGEEKKPVTASPSYIYNKNDSAGSRSSLVKKYNGPAPYMACLPHSVENNEPALIIWQCLDASESASGFGFETGGEPMGIAEVNNATTTTYKVACASGATASCDVRVSRSAIILEADEAKVDSFDKTKIRWRTVDMQNCVLDSDDDSSKYKDWRRSGTNSTDGVFSHPITKLTKFTLSCITKSGMRKSATVEVGVN